MVFTTMIIMTFIACGGDDESNYKEESFIGVHRVDIQFSENITGCEVLNIFYGLRADGNFSNLYEGGKQLTLDDRTHTWYTEEARPISIQTEDGCGAVVAAITITTPNVRPLTYDITVTAVGFVDGKQIKTQVFTLPAGHTTMSAALSTDDTELHDEAII